MTNAEKDLCDRLVDFMKKNSKYLKGNVAVDLLVRRRGITNTEEWITICLKDEKGNCSYVRLCYPPKEPYFKTLRLGKEFKGGSYD